MFFFPIEKTQYLAQHPVDYHPRSVYESYGVHGRVRAAASLFCFGGAS